MRLEEEIFNKFDFDESKLLSFGFTKLKDKSFIYETKIFNDKFLVKILVKDNKLEGKLFDLEMDNEEYTLIHNDFAKGNYVAKIKEEYLSLLETIRTNCCKERKYLSPQTKRIVKKIKEDFNDEPEYVFKKIKDCFVLRNNETKKWYGIVMTVKKSAITKNEKDIEKIEILNLKVDEAKLSELLELPGFYNSYHMNHKSWVTISLTEDVPDDLIIELLSFAKSSVGKNKN